MVRRRNDTHACLNTYFEIIQKIYTAFWWAFYIFSHEKGTDKSVRLLHTWFVFLSVITRCAFFWHNQFILLTHDVYLWHFPMPPSEHNELSSMEITNYNNTHIRTSFLVASIKNDFNWFKQLLIRSLLFFSIKGLLICNQIKHIEKVLTEEL